MTKDEALTRDWKNTIDERIARDDDFKESLLQEPYAYAYVREDGVGQLCWTKRDTNLFKDVLEGWKEIPLYTHPSPSWQGLSDDEIEEIVDCPVDVLYSGDYEIYRAIEQALKEKNYEIHGQ